MPDESATLAEEVKRLRKLKKLSQEMLAQKVGMTQGWVSHIETGFIVVPASNVMNKLCSALGVPLDHFAKFISPNVELPPPPVGDPRQLPILPILGAVGAGPAVDDAAEHDEHFEPAKAFPEASKMYRVRGHSMEEAGIYDGDLVVVRTHPLPKSGEKVVAWIAAEAGHVCKRYKGRGLSRWLEDAQGFRHDLAKGDVILGVYIGLVRQDRP